MNKFYINAFSLLLSSSLSISSFAHFGEEEASSHSSSSSSSSSSTTQARVSASLNIKDFLKSPDRLRLEHGLANFSLHMIEPKIRDRAVVPHLFAAMRAEKSGDYPKQVICCEEAILSGSIRAMTMLSTIYENAGFLYEAAQWQLLAFEIFLKKGSNEMTLSELQKGSPKFLVYADLRAANLPETKKTRKGKGEKKQKIITPKDRKNFFKKSLDSEYPHCNEEQKEKALSFLLSFNGKPVHTSTIWNEFYIAFAKGCQSYMFAVDNPDYSSILFALGQFYEYSSWQDYQRAADFYRRSDTPNSLNSLGSLYLEGKVGLLEDGNPDFEKAREYFEQSAINRSLFNLGQLYYEGKVGLLEDGNPDFEKAREYFEQSGTPYSLFNLGLLHYQGEVGLLGDLKPNFAKAKEYFEQSRTPKSLYNLGLLYLKGKIDLLKDGKPNFEKARECFEQSNIPEAINNLGLLYFQGKIGLLKDGKSNFAKAKEYFEQSGTPDSLYNLGLLYLHGKIGLQKDGKPNFEKAKEYFEQSGTPDSLFELGFLYHMGNVGMLPTNVPDYKKAEKLYLKAKISASFLSLLFLYQSGSYPVHDEAKTNLLSEMKKYIDSEKNVKLNNECAAYYYLCKGNYELAYLAISAATAHGSTLFKEVHYTFQSYFEKNDESKTSSQISSDKDDSSGDKSEQSVMEGIEKENFSLFERTLPEQEGIDEETLSVGIDEASFDKKKSAKKELDVKGESDVKSDRKKNKKLRSTQKRLLSFEEKLKKEMGHTLSKLKKPQDYAEIPKRKELEYVFDNKKVENEFNALRADSNSKLSEFLADMQQKPWRTSGAGKPEVLRGGKYGGCISRRLDHKNRFVYRVTSDGKINVLSISGHYE